MWFSNTCRLTKPPLFLLFNFIFFFLLICLFLSFSPSPKNDFDDDSPHGVFPRLLPSAPSEDRSKPPRTTTVSVLTASMSVFSVRRQIQTHHGRRLCRSSQVLLRIGDSLRFPVIAAVVKKFMKVSPIHRRFLFHASLILYDLIA